MLPPWHTCTKINKNPKSTQILKIPKWLPMAGFSVNESYAGDVHEERV